jgi:hypothetical protein
MQTTGEKQSAGLKRDGSDRRTSSYTELPVLKTVVDG